MLEVALNVLAVLIAVMFLVWSLTMVVLFLAYTRGLAERRPRRIPSLTVLKSVQ